jgi:hypothetical protein
LTPRTPPSAACDRPREVLRVDRAPPQSGRIADRPKPLCAGRPLLYLRGAKGRGETDIKAFSCERRFPIRKSCQIRPSIRGETDLPCSFNGQFLLRQSRSTPCLPRLSRRTQGQAPYAQNRGSHRNAHGMAFSHDKQTIAIIISSLHKRSHLGSHNRWQGNHKVGDRSNVRAG